VTVRYLFLIYLDERANAARSEAEVKAGMASHVPYIERLKRNRQYVASDPLGPPAAARTLRTSGGKPVVTEGPFAESREQLGGYYVVDAEHLDEAIALAEECPALKTVAIGIEIRPIPAPVQQAPAPGPRYFVALYPNGDDVDGAHASFLQPLAPPGSATTLRFREGKVTLTDGPFADASLGAYGVVSARDLDEACALAASSPDARRHAIEVRAIRGA
jgi:hypothetical protein